MGNYMCGEIAVELTERRFHSLGAPVLRVTGFHVPSPPGRVEEDVLPDLDRVPGAVDRSFEYCPHPD
jgi:pyruvate dehydrogenase E1 component beta subunit